MKRLLSLMARIFSSIISFPILLIFSLPANSDTIRFASTDYCPFTCNPATENGKEGIMTDVVRAAFEELGHTVEIDLMPYARGVHLVKQGRYDGIMVVGKPYAPELTYTKIPTLAQRAMFMVKPTHKWRFTGNDSLHEVTIAIIKGFDYADDRINSYIKDNEHSNKITVLHGSNTTERGLKMLHSDRVDTYIEGQLTALYHISKYELTEKFIVAGFSSRSFEVYTAFSPKSSSSDEYADVLTRKIHEMKESGELDDIVKQYGVLVTL